MGVDFAAGWYATDLGDYRPCQYTYEGYDYDTLPALDAARLTGAFQWLGDPGEVVPEQVAQLREVQEGLAAKGLALPEDFVRFHTSSNLLGSLDEVSVTACWSSLSAPLPSPVEPGAFLVRFFRDQQDCVLWYLYLRPTGEVFVVVSYLDYEYEYEVRDSGDEEQPHSDLGDAAVQRAAILRCAPSFEQFAYRFWLENRIWRALNGDEGDGPIDSEMQAYLHHYESLSPQGA